ncbi:MAG: Na+/H+ antiporter subunit C [Planctomycetota bacterium]
MTLLVAISVGVLFAAGSFMLLRRSFVKLVLGLALLGHAANLLIYVSAGLVKGRPPLVEVGESAPEIPHSDPLPAALILTAIVISFAVMSFTIVLIKRAYQDIGTDDLNMMRSTDT